jgi:hypothetical protein
MPAVSDKQKKFMDAAAHNPAFAKKVGVPTSVAEDFSSASKGQKFGNGTRPDKQEINKPKTNHGDMALFKKGGNVKDESKSEMKKEMAADKKQDVAMIKKAFKEHDTQEHKGGKGTKISLRKGGNVKKMAKGGMSEVMGPRTMGKDVEKGSNKLTSFGQSAVQKRAMTKGKNLGDSGPSAGIQSEKGKPFAKGGSVRGDGIAQRGKTKGKSC